MKQICVSNIGYKTLDFLIRHIVIVFDLQLKSRGALFKTHAFNIRGLEFDYYMLPVK